MNRFLVFTLALLLSACAPMKISKQDEQHIKTVAVVSLIPETTSLTKIGLTVFNNEETEFDMKGQIRETLESAAAERLARTRPNWSVKKIAYDRQALFNALHSGSVFTSSGEEKVKKDLGELARKNGVDAILVFVPASYDSNLGAGVGIRVRTFGLKALDSAFAHAYVSLSLISPRGDLLAEAAHGFDIKIRPIHPDAVGIKYPLGENLRPEVTEALAAAIRGVLADNTVMRLMELGM